MQKIIIIILGTYLNVLNRISKKIGGKHAFLLFCYPFPVKLKPAQQKFLDTSNKSFTQFDNKKIATYIWGNGPKRILCLHGWQSQTFRWKKYIESLDKEKYTIIAIDAPAHGESDGKVFNVPMYARLIEQLIIEHKMDYILAHSLGVFSAMCLFSEKPELAPEKFAALATPSNANFFIDEFVRVLRVNVRVRKNLVDYFEGYAGTTPDYYDSLNFAQKQTSHGLLIHDKEDGEATYDNVVEINKLWPNSTLYTTNGFGHKLRDISVVNKVVDFFE
ncbi:MAG: hypothetical protein COA58_05810 [Bacteroidetes bacterium]|nr:MAG: hypothetical protein COA58_05810 [Bacteroidota bacterium]